MNGLVATPSTGAALKNSDATNEPTRVDPVRDMAPHSIRLQRDRAKLEHQIRSFIEAILPPFEGRAALGPPPCFRVWEGPKRAFSEFAGED